MELEEGRTSCFQKMNETTKKKYYSGDLLLDGKKVTVYINNFFNKKKDGTPCNPYYRVSVKYKKAEEQPKEQEQYKAGENILYDEWQNA